MVRVCGSSESNYEFINDDIRSSIIERWFPMNREEYMNSLKKALKDMDDEISIDIIGDYDQHFAMGLKSGKSEEQICEELGNVDEFIEEINELKKNAKPKEQKGTNVTELPARIENVKNQKTSLEGKKIVVDTKGADLIVVRSDDQKVNAYYENFGSLKQQMIYQFYFYEETDTIFIGVNQTDTKGGFFNRILVPEMRITIYIPDGIESMIIKTPSGDTRMEGISLGEVEIEAISGDVFMKQILAKKIGLRTCSGDINIRNAKSKYINMRSTSGDVEVVDVISEQCYIGSTSGDVEYLNVTGMKVEVTSSSGDICIREGMAEHMTVKTSSGDLEMSRLKVVELIGSCSSGDVSVEHLTVVNGRIESSSGDLEIQWVYGNQLICRSSSGEVNLQGSLQSIQASSVSGDITIENEGDFNGDFKTTSGDMQVKLKNSGNGYHANIKSNSGDTNIMYCGKRISTDKKGIYTYGNEGTKLELLSVSGDIRISD